MSKHIGRKLNTEKGFTLAELLVTVAIMAILAAISFVSVISYQRKLKLVEMDGKAKSVYMAAQNHLTMEKANGTLDKLPDTTLPYVIHAGGTAITENTGTSASGSAADTADTMLSYMLPLNSISDAIRIDGNYLITYDLASGSVKDVFYSEDYKFTDSDISGSDAEEIVSTALVASRLDSEKRMHFNGSEGNTSGGDVVGYYGADGNSGNTDSSVKLPAPVLELTNGNTLFATITLPGITMPAGGSISINLLVEGLSSGKSASIPLEITPDKKTQLSSGTTYEYVLDDITTPDHRFAYNPEFKDFIPGEDIKVSAEVFSSDTLASIEKSNTETENSLFGSISVVGGNASAVNEYKANVGNIRQLENLDSRISGVNQKTVTGSDGTVHTLIIDEAKQTADIASSAFFDDSKLSGKSIYKGDSNSTPGSDGCFRSIDLSSPLSYDGQNFEISGLNISETGDAGIFGTIGGSEGSSGSLNVKNLMLVNNTVTSTGGNAAILAGKVSGTADCALTADKLIINNGIVNASGNSGNAGIIAGDVSGVGFTATNILAYHTTAAEKAADASKAGLTSSVTSKAGVAGGLTGSIADAASVNISNSAVAVYVSGKSSAGGIAGKISGAGKVTINNSYVSGHTYEGKLENSDTAGNERFDSNILSEGISGGLIGDMETAAAQLTVTCSYVTCSVKGNTAGMFIGNQDISGQINSTVYASGRLAAGDAAADKEVNIADNTPDESAQKEAEPYDAALIKDGVSKYPFKTVGQLSGNTTAAAWYLNVQVGDWQPVAAKYTLNFNIRSNDAAAKDYSLWKTLQFKHGDYLQFLPHPVLKDYVFKGWYPKDVSDLTDNQIYSLDGFKSAMGAVQGDEGLLNAYGEYQKISYYTVKLHYMYYLSTGSENDLTEFGSDSYVHYAVNDNAEFDKTITMPAVNNLTFHNVTVRTGNSAEISVSNVNTSARTAEIAISNKTDSTDVELNVIYTGTPVKADYKVYHKFNNTVANAGGTVSTDAESIDTSGFTYSAYSTASRTITETKNDIAGNATAAKPKTARGFTAGSVINQIIKADGSTSVEIVYTRNNYIATFETTGGTKADGSIYQPVRYAYMQPVELSDPVRQGYAFAGWTITTKYSGTAVETTRSGDKTVFNMPDENITAVASWVPETNTQYHIVYMLENANDDEYSYSGITEEKTGTTGQTTPVFSKDDIGKKFENFTFDHADQKTIKGDGSTVIAAYYKRNEYSIHFMQYEESEIKVLDSIDEDDISDYYYYYKYSIYRSWMDENGVKHQELGSANGQYPYTWSWNEISIPEINENENAAFTESDFSYQAHEITYQYQYYNYNKNNGWNSSNIKYGLYRFYYNENGKLLCDQRKNRSSSWNTYTYLDRPDGIQKYYPTYSYNYNYYRIITETGNSWSPINTLTITAKYGANIGYKWPDYKSGWPSSWTTTPDGSTYQSGISTMPSGGADFYYKYIDGDYTYYTYFYMQNITDDAFTKNDSYTNTIKGGWFSYTVTEEDHYAIEGFTYVNDYTDEIPSDQNGNKAHGLGDGNDGWQFYYTRNRYTITFNANGGTGDFTEDYRYQADIGNLGSAGSVSRSGYLFAGWYTDPECTGQAYDFTNKTMPANNMIFYAKWQAPVYTVNFDMNDPLGSDEISPAMSGAQSVSVDGGQSIEDSIVDTATGNLKTEYTPSYALYADDARTKPVYRFTGWAVKDAAGTYTPYIYATKINQNTTLYAQWEQIAGTVKVTIQYIFQYLDENGDTKSTSIREPQVIDLPIGANLEFAASVDGYTATEFTKTIYVTADGENTVTFVYNKNNVNWKYKVQYQLRDNGITTALPENTSKTVAADFPYQSIQFSLPDGYSPDAYQLAAGESELQFVGDQDDMRTATFIIEKIDMNHILTSG